MTFCLDSTIVKPKNEKDIRYAIILLHGYGGDGKDISMLTFNWRRYMPNTIFICPNGYQTCEINPTGYQWFDLTKDDPKYILSESLKAEKKLNEFVSEIKKYYHKYNQIQQTYVEVYLLKHNHYRLYQQYQQYMFLFLSA